MLSNRETRFFVLYCLGITFGIQYIYVNKNVTIEEAWTTCHRVYNGSLADIKSIDISALIEHGDKNNLSDTFWNVEFEKTTKWITFEGCYDGNELDINSNTNLTSIAQCQKECGHEPDTYFTVGDTICLCNDTTWNLTLTMNRGTCDSHCGVSGVCGKNSTQVNIYRNVEVNLTTSDKESKLCLGFKCHQRDPTEFTAIGCNAHHPYVCGKNSSDEYHTMRVFADFINECWNITADYKDFMTSSICPFLKFYVNQIRWTPVFRKKFYFQDTEDATIDELRSAIKITGLDRNKRKPFFCKTDTQDMSTIGNTPEIQPSLVTTETSSSTIPKVTSFSTEPKSSRAWTTPSIYWSDQNRGESKSVTLIYVLLVGILVLLTVLPLLYIKDHVSRQQSEVVSLEMQNRTLQAGVQIITRPEAADGNRTIRNNNHDNVSQDDIDVVHNDKDVTYNEDVERRNLAVSNDMEDRTYIEIVSDQSESETGNGEQTYYSEVPERLYETLNAGGNENVYDEVLKK